MKLASLKDGTRDGRLVVVSKDLTRCSTASDIAPTLQAALDEWQRCAPMLEGLYRDVEHWAVPCERFHMDEALSPLPRAYQWADGSAYINHVELVRAARNDKVPESFYDDPLMYQGGSDAFLGPRDAIPPYIARLRPRRRPCRRHASHCRGNLPPLFHLSHACAKGL